MTTRQQATALWQQCLEAHVGRPVPPGRLAETLLKFAAANERSCDPDTQHFFVAEVRVARMIAKAPRFGRAQLVQAREVLQAAGFVFEVAE